MKREAIEKLRQFRLPAEKGECRLSEFTEKYILCSSVVHQPSTNGLIMDILRPFTTKYGTLTLAELTPSLPDNYRIFLSDGRKPSTVLIHLRQLKAMFAYAVGRKYMLQSPMQHMNNLYVKHPRKM